MGYTNLEREVFSKMRYRTKYDYEQAYIRFITNEDSAYLLTDCAREFKIPKSTFFDHLKVDPRDWEADRKANIKHVDDNVISNINRGKVRSKTVLIEKLETMISKAYNIISDFLGFIEKLTVYDIDKCFFDIKKLYPRFKDEENDDAKYYERLVKLLIKNGVMLSLKDITELMRVLKMLSREYGILEGFIKSGGGTTIRKTTYNLNIPIQYLTTEGLKYLENKQKNPQTIDAKDVDYEIIQDKE